MLITERMNLFVGVDDPSLANSKHLTLQEVKLPALEETFQEHNPGGGVSAIEIAVGMEKLECSFKLVGHDPNIFKYFGLARNGDTLFTFRSHLVDKITGDDMAMRATVKGRLAKIDPDTYKAGDLQTHDYEIKGILQYALYYGTKEAVFLDWASNTLRADGVDQYARRNAALGIG